MDADVAYPFTGSTLMVDILILVRIPWGFGDGNEINRTAIAAWGTGFDMRAGIDMFAFKGAAVFTGILLKVTLSGAFSDDLALRWITIRALISQCSSNS